MDILKMVTNEQLKKILMNSVPGILSGYTSRSKKAPGKESRYLKVL